MEHLLTIILIFVLLSYVVRRLFPILLLKYMSRKMGKGVNSVEERAKKRKRRKGGDQYVTGKGEEKIVSKDVGEYVDFQEIE